MNKKFITNPFSMYGVAFGVVLFLYSFGWSDLYPKLSLSLLAFILSTICVMFGISYLFYRRNYFTFQKIAPSLANLKWQIIGCYTLLSIEFAAAQSIPLVSMVIGGGSDYTEFGLPFIHIIVVAWIEVLNVFIFHAILSKSKGERKKLVYLLICTLLPSILIVNRSMIMISSVSCAVIYLMQVKSVSAVFLKVVLSALVLFFFFGLMGNYRTSGRGDSEVIMNIGGASDDFRGNLVPGEYFWSYIYIVSPMGNLQYNVNQDKGNAGDVSANNLTGMFLYELSPTMISKRIGPTLNMEQKNALRVNPLLNVYGVYAGPFAYAGWTGMWITFGFTIIFIFVNLFFVPKDSPYFVTAVAILCSTIALNTFANFFSQMNMVSQLFIVNILSLKYLLHHLKR